MNLDKTKAIELLNKIMELAKSERPRDIMASGNDD